MEKIWFPQKNVLDAPVAIIKNFIYYLGLKISRPTIEKVITEHAEYPSISAPAMLDIFKNWGLKTVAFNWQIEKLNELPAPSLLFIEEEDGNKKLGLFIMFYGIKDNVIEYLHPRKGWVLEGVTDFADKWTKAVIAPFQIIAPDGEADFMEKEAAYDQKRINNPDLKNVIAKEDFLTDEECKYIINLSNDLFKRSAIMDEENVQSYGRTSYSAELVFPNDKILNVIRKRAAEFLEVPESHFEFFQCVSYEVGQEYQKHYDTFDDTSERGKLEIQTNGQRKYTMLAYLNDDFQGGATHFPNLDLLVQPKKGKILVFNNLDDEGKVIKAAFHAGLPVTTGRKYAMNMWVRTQPIRH
jgi:prolyl 4-hydroxylase